MAVHPFQDVFLSRPAVVLPRRKVDNTEVIELVRASFAGSAHTWRRLHAGILRVFRLCNSQVRYFELEPEQSVAAFAVRAASQCLRDNEVDPQDVDLVIYAGIAREYFEPATAMEVADRLGATGAHAFDVANACAGQLQAIDVARSYVAARPHVRTALVCSGELTRNFLSFDIQSLDELKVKAAGLTLGNAAAAWLLRRESFAGGCSRLVTMQSMSRPQHWRLCRAPLDQPFTSNSHELFKLVTQVPPELRRVVGLVGWSIPDVRHFIFHQPSDLMVREVMEALGVGLERAVQTHHLYGNTASTTVALAMSHLLETRTVQSGDRIVLSSAGAGFSMVTALAEWVG